MKTATKVLPRRLRRSRIRSNTATGLRHALDRLLAPGPRVVGMTTRPLPYASSFAIEEIDVLLEDGGRLDLVCKNTGYTAMLPEARRIKPSFLRDPRREIAAYESILQPLGIGAPKFYGAVVDEARDRYWLFLERVNGPPLAEIGDFDVWLEVAAWLARLHLALQRHTPSPLVLVPLVHHDSEFYRRWMPRARRFVEDALGSTRSRRASVRWLASCHERVVDELAAMPTTLIHGEFYASNVLVELCSGQPHVRALDWELTAVGCSFMDLAALTAGWADELRSELMCRYYAELREGSRTWLPPDEFIRAVECCRLQLAVQCLGWADQWTPPAAHAHDWLDDALAAAERLGF